MMPDKTSYPMSYDTPSELKTVVDSLISTVIAEITPYNSLDKSTYDWENGDGVIFLDDTSRWPDSGFVTVYLKEHWGSVSERATLFHFSGKNNASLIGVMLVHGQKLKYFPEGSFAVQNVVAQNHNYGKDAILALEGYLGHRKTDDATTIEWFTDLYARTVRVPKPWLDISPTKAFVGDFFTFTDMTARVSPGFAQSDDSKVAWRLSFGDGVTTLVTLDAENKEYVFTTTRPGESDTVERRSAWSGVLKHRYASAGMFTITLTVWNEFGEDTLVLKDIVRVMSEVRGSLEIDVSFARLQAGDDSAQMRASESLADDDEVDLLGFLETGQDPSPLPSPDNMVSRNRVIAKEDQVTVRGLLSGDADMRIAKYVWDFGANGPSNVPNASLVNIIFELGGIYDVGLRVISDTGSWISAAAENAVDVVEKPSVWHTYSSGSSGSLSMNEYSIGANAWKSPKIVFNLDYQFDFSGEDSLRFMDDKGFHNKINSNNAFVLWSLSEVMLGVAQFNSLTSTAVKRTENPQIFYNWYTLYMPDYNTDAVFILGGVSDLSDLGPINQRIVYYGIGTNSFIVVPNEYVLPLDGEDSTASKTVAYENSEKLLTNPNATPAKWRSTSYAGKGYLLRSSEKGMMDDFFSFDPATTSFMSIVSRMPFSKRELCLDSLSGGVYALSNAGDLHVFDPLSETWTSIVSSAVDAFADVFHTADPSSRNPDAGGVSGTKSRALDADNEKLYFSYDYSTSSFGRFDVGKMVFEQLSPRPEPQSQADRQWDMGVF